MKKTRSLFLVALMIVVVSFAYSEIPTGKSWGLSAQVSHGSPWVGAVFHLGSHFMIRPGILIAGSPAGAWASWNLRSDFLFTGHTKSNLMWYVGPSIVGEVSALFDTGAFDVDIQIAVKTGVQAMIAPHVALYTDIGIQVDGTIPFGGIAGIYFQSYGVGAVIYIK